MEKQIRKIVIIGPESTGKSTLCTQLATHFKTKWVPEYARTYLETNGTNYTFENLYEIAVGQLASEDAAVTALQQQHLVQPTPLFIDTDMYVMKVWSEFVFNKCDNRILNHINQRSYDLYLLCNVDLPWVKDNLREYPDLATRDKLFHYYKDAMVTQQTPWVIIKGNYEQRLQQAIAAVHTIL